MKRTPVQKPMQNGNQNPDCPIDFSAVSAVTNALPFAAGLPLVFHGIYPRTHNFRSVHV